MSSLFLLRSTLRHQCKRAWGVTVKEMQNRLQKDAILLEIRLLGALAILRADGVPVALPGRKDRALLAYLAAHSGVTLARDRLVELIWPDAAEGAGRASLRQALSTIRKVLGDAAGGLIVADRDTVTLATGGLVTDVAALEVLTAEPDTAESVQAVPEGEFLEGMTGISPAFDTWRVTEQARLAAQAVNLLDELAGRAEAQRRFADAAALLTQALAIDPLGEATHRRLMQVQAAQGRTDVALRQFRTLEQLLKTELGVRPEKETMELVRDIRARRQKGETPRSATPPIEPEADAGISYPVSKVGISAGIDLSPPESPSIAVLAFSNMSADPEQEYFSDGIAEEIITALSKIDELLVIARNSSFTYKGKPVDVKQVSREQGVRYVLEGSVRKAGERVRVTAQLIDAATGHHVWAERYDRDLEDIFLIQDEVTREVVVALDVHLRGGEQMRIWSSGTSNVEAWECVRRGMDALNRITPESRIEAQRLLTRARDLDPDYPMAWVSLGWLHFHEAEFSTSRLSNASREAALLSAVEIGRKALDLDPTCADAYALLGLCSLSTQEYDQAVDLTERAIALAPNLAENLATSAMVLSKSGRPERSFELIKRAMRLCPIYPGWYLHILGTACRLMGQNESAASAFEEGIKRNADNLAMHVGLASTLGELGRPEDARKPVSAILRIDPRFSIQKYVGELSYRNPTDLARIAAGLRTAGLPE
jgi:TolB-like protein/DNA-binding SARP family transcriptional activator